MDWNQCLRLSFCFVFCLKVSRKLGISDEIVVALSTVDRQVPSLVRFVTV